MIKLIIFDWDDVITIGSTEGYFKCYHEMLVDLGVILEPVEERKRIVAKWGKSQLEEQRELLKEKPELLQKANEIYESKLFGTTFVNELRLTEGTIGLLNELRQKYVLAVATGVNPKLLVEVIMPKFGIPDIFSKIISSCSITDPAKQKPSPYMLQAIMNTLGFGPDQTLFVGDAKSDVLMARQAKVEPVVVLTGHLNQKEAQDLGVKYIIENVTYLPEVLKNMPV